MDNFRGYEADNDREDGGGMEEDMGPEAAQSKSSRQMHPLHVVDYINARTQRPKYHRAYRLAQSYLESISKLFITHTAGSKSQPSSLWMRAAITIPKLPYKIMQVIPLCTTMFAHGLHSEDAKISSTPSLR